MKLLFVTDLHGCEWKYDNLFSVAQKQKTNIVINGGDMLPHLENLFDQDKFISNFLNKHFEILHANPLQIPQKNQWSLIPS